MLGFATVAVEIINKSVPRTGKEFQRKDAKALGRKKTKHED